MESYVKLANCRDQGYSFCQADASLDLFMTALSGENLFDHVFQGRFSIWKGLGGGLAA